MIKIQEKNKINLTLRNHKNITQSLPPNPQKINDQKQQEQENNIAKQLIFLYTFDPETTMVSSENDNSKMLIYSLLSVTSEFPEAKIILYTFQTEKMRSILSPILPPEKIEIKQIDKTYMTQGIENKFAQIGHARIFIIPEHVTDQQHYVIYMDNDTYIKPASRKIILNMLQYIKNPVGYSLETYTTIHKWILTSSQIRDKKILEEITGKMASRYTINNGILIFPPNESSCHIAELIKTRYMAYSQQYGYFYGLDMLIFSLIMHEHEFKTTNIMHLIGKRGLVHYYLYKTSYIKLIRQELTKLFPDIIW